MQCKTAVARLKNDSTRLFPLGAAEAAFNASVDTLYCRLRNAVIDDIDHTANGAAAVEQCRRSAHDFRAFDHQRIDRYRVVKTQRRGVQHADAVLQQADAVTIKAADHRTAGVGAETGRGHPGQAVQRVAERGTAQAEQFFALHHRCR